MKKGKTASDQRLTPEARSIAACSESGDDSHIGAKADPVCLTVSVEDAARILGISRGAAYKYADDGKLPAIRIGKRLLVPKKALDRLLSVA